MKKAFTKYFFYFLNLALFIALILYAKKYYPTILLALESANLNYLAYAFGLFLVIVAICAFKWSILIKIFNREVSFFDLFIIYFISNMYKYVPPKGMNYVMKYKLCSDYYKRLDGKISSMFAESFAELLTACLFAVVFLLFMIDYGVWVQVLGFVALITMVTFLIYPKVFYFVPIRAIKKLILQFSRIRKTKTFYYSFLLNMMLAILHGFAFYFILFAFDVHLGILLPVILFYASQFFVFITFSPAGLGVRDITLVGALVLFSVDPAVAITVSLMHRVLMLSSELVVGLPSMVYKKLVVDPSAS